MAKDFEASLKPSHEICGVFRTLCKGVSGIGSRRDRLRAQCGALKSSVVFDSAALAYEEFGLGLEGSSECATVYARYSAF